MFDQEKNSHLMSLSILITCSPHHILKLKDQSHCPSLLHSCGKSKDIENWVEDLPA